MIKDVAIVPPPNSGTAHFRLPGGGDEWRVTWKGRLCSPSWTQRGPAVAYLHGLCRGTRQPEYSTEEQR